MNFTWIVDKWISGDDYTLVSSQADVFNCGYKISIRIASIMHKPTYATAEATAIRQQIPTLSNHKTFLLTFKIKPGLFIANYSYCVWLTSSIARIPQ